MAKIKSKVSQSSEQSIAQNASQSEQQASQNEQPVAQKIKPHYPNWPTSKPGAPSTLPPAGTHSVNAFRPEQVAPISSNQEEVGLSLADSSQHSVPDASTYDTTSFDQPKNVLDTLGKRKHRL